MWWLCVQTLSRAGIRHAWRRAVFLAFVVPLTVAGSLLVPATSLTLVITLQIEYGTHGTPSGMVGCVAGQLATVTVASIVILCGCGRLTR